MWDGISRGCRIIYLLMRLNRLKKTKTHNLAMPQAHKKEVYTRSLIEDPQLSEDKVTGEFKGFPLEYRNGVIHLSKEYRHIHAVIERWDEGKKDHIKRPVVFDSVKVTAEFRGEDWCKGFYGTQIVINCGYATAEFKLDEKKYKVDYGIFERDNPNPREYLSGGYSDFEDKRLYFTGRFNSRVREDFLPFRDYGLVDILRFDKHVAPLFMAKVETGRKNEKLVLELAVEAEYIGRNYDIEKNPLPLQPIFKRAKEAGVVDELIKYLRKEAWDKRDHDRNAAVMKEISYGMGMLPERPLVSPEVSSMLYKHMAHSLDSVVKALERFNEKPTKQQEKEAAEWLAFDNALKKVDEMMAKEDWSNTDRFALRVIEEIKPICEPKKFAETLKRLMEFKQDDGMIQQLSAVYSPMYFRNFIRRIGGDISDEELEDLFGKGKERVGQYVRGVADETRGRELLALSEAILKRC